jgi:hypothetical protein
MVQSQPLSFCKIFNIVAFMHHIFPQNNKERPRVTLVGMNNGAYLKNEKQGLAPIRPLPWVSPP